MANEKRLIDADSLKERFLIVAQSGGPVVVHVSDICAAIEDEVYEGTVDAMEVVHGRWIEKQEAIPWCEDDVEVYTVCSVCESYSPGESNYCPNCGAKMDGGKE